MTIAIRKWDEGGYWMILDDGIGIARTKSKRQALRIAAALSVPPVEEDPPNEDRPSYRDLVDLLRMFSVADTQAAEVIQLQAQRMINRIDATEPTP